MKVHQVFLGVLGVLGVGPEITLQAQKTSKTRKKIKLDYLVKLRNIFYLPKQILHVEVTTCGETHR